MVDYFPCDRCIVDAICITGCDIFQDYINDRLLGVVDIPEDFVSSGVRYTRSLKAKDDMSLRWFRLSVARGKYLDNHLKK